jgi:hypothetical protein
MDAWISNIYIYITMYNTYIYSHTRILESTWQFSRGSEPMVMYYFSLLIFLLWWNVNESAILGFYRAGEISPRAGTSKSYVQYILYVCTKFYSVLRSRDKQGLLFYWSLINGASTVLINQLFLPIHIHLYLLLHPLHQAWCNRRQGGYVQQ